MRRLTGSRLDSAGQAQAQAHAGNASASLLSWQELPLHFRPASGDGAADGAADGVDAGLDVAVDELSGVAWHETSAPGSDPSSVVVAVGDGGRLFVAEFDAAHGTLDGWIGVTLEAPDGEAFVDAESVAVVCPGGATSCSLEEHGSSESASVLVGSERGEGRKARITEYHLNGTIKQADALGESVLRLLGVDSASQGRNLGFEALALTPDKTRVLFTTEGPVAADASDAPAPRALRLVLWDRARREGSIFRYEVNTAGAGVTDVAFLDESGGTVSVLERAYNSTSGINTVHLYCVDLLDAATQSVAVSHSQADDDAPPQQQQQQQQHEQHEQQVITQAFHALGPLEARLLFDFADAPQVLDNYEGATLLPGERLFLVTDNNKDANQRTFLTTLQLQLPASGTDAPATVAEKQPPALVALGVVAVALLVALLACVAKSALTRCFRPEAAAYRDVGDDFVRDDGCERDRDRDQDQQSRQAQLELQPLEIPRADTPANDFASDLAVF